MVNVVLALQWAADELVREYLEIGAEPVDEAGQEIIEHVATLRRAAEILEVLSQTPNSPGTSTCLAVSVLRRAASVLEVELGIEMR